ncbi:MAG: hypothetical protein N2652_02850 [Kiritimatiellae bacterium]|nr:hypothetical protein [Kiritimatiellia bacterium]
MSPSSPSRRRPSYRRLPGRWYGVATKATAWLGPDHLLVVERAWFVEHYRRLQFRDIEAVILQRTRAREIGASLGALSLAAGLSLALLWTGPLTARVVGALIAAAGAVALGLELSRGRGCATTVRTRTSSVLVRAWSRERPARRGIARLCQAIAVVQPPLTPEMLAAAAASRLDPSAATRSAFPPAVPPPLPPLPLPRRWAGALCALLIVEGLAAVAGLRVQALPATLATLAITSMALLVGSVMMLGRTTATHGAKLRHWAIAVILYWTLRAVALYVLSIMAGLGYTPTGSGLELLMKPPGVPAPAMVSMLGVIASVSPLLAIWGGLAARRSR